MDESDAHEYYQRILQLGSGAAKFKQGLGFGNSAVSHSPPPPDSKFTDLSAIRRKLQKRHSEPVNQVHDRARKRTGSRSRSRSHERDRRRDSSERGRIRESSHGGRSETRQENIERRGRDGYRGRRRSRSRSRSVDHGRNRQMTLERSRTGGRRSRSPRMDKRSKNYSELIVGYENMTAIEKVKAKMRFQLSETVARDSKKGMKKDWERFDFNQSAPMDDENKQDDFGDGTDSKDDTAFLNRLGTTFGSSQGQVARERHVQSVHDSAIFGAPPSGLKVKKSQLLREEGKGLTFVDDPMDCFSEEDEQDRPIVVFEGTNGRDSPPRGDTSVEEVGQEKKILDEPNVASDVVVAMQKGSTWQERARKIKESRVGNF